MAKPVLDARPALVSGIGGLLIVLTVAFTGDFHAISSWILGLGGLLAMGGAWWYRHRLREPDRLVEEEKAQILADREMVDRETRALELYKSEVEEEAIVLEKRRHKLSLQLAQTVGWWDMDEMAEAEEVSKPLTDERERQVLAFCKGESERLFNKVIENGYVRNGVLQPEEIYKDVIQLFEGVAKIYRPDSDDPLLETSMEQVLRFMHNVSLQLLVQLEQLPVDVKRFNLRETYRFMKKAMDYYGMYKKVNPYWNYAKPAIFLGRFALGANPITLGISWTLTELASLGGKKISSRYTKKYGLRMFHESIRIVGSETAAVYGADFRERDPDRIFATELIEMVHHFPPSRESLEASLKEIGRLPLHSEYDRVYLYRCLANRFSAKPRRRDCAVADGIEVAKRLEKVFAMLYGNENPDQVNKWRRAAEARLGVKLQLAGNALSLDRPDELRAGFYSIASYLIGHKMLELDVAEKHLGAMRLANLMEGEELSKALLQVRQKPPMVFDYPECLLSKDVAKAYMDDLIDSQLGVFPREVDGHLVEEAAAYFRDKPEDWHDRVDERAREFLLGQLPPGAQQTHIDARVARALLTALAPGERMQLLYPVSGVEGDITFHASFKALWLAGTNKRPLTLLGAVERPEGPWHIETLWHPDGGALSLDHSKTFLTQAYRLRGGTWDAAQAEVKSGGKPPVIRMRNRRGSSNESYFMSLRERYLQLTGHDAAESALEGLEGSESVS